MKKGFLFNLDWGLLVPVLILSIFGLATLFSINIVLFRSQLIFLIISFVFFIFFSYFEYRSAQYYSLPIYIISLVLLASLLIFGSASRGAVRWIEFFGVQLQFSEILKPFLALCLASFLSNRGHDLKSLLITLGYIVPVLFLIYKQPDLGNAIIYLIVAIFVLFIYGFPLRWFAFGFVATLLSMPVFWHFMHDYQRQRILTFIYPAADPLGVSYNAMQAIIAVGSGMFFGKGISGATQSGLRFLPERHTDFIFATLSEKFGFISTLIILLCFAFLLYRIYVIFNNSKDRFCKIFTISAFFFILIHTFINIGMNIGLLPIVGVTLPFLSYGGSSLLSNFIILGLVASIGRDYQNLDVLEIK